MHAARELAHEAEGGQAAPVREADSVPYGRERVGVLCSEVRSVASPGDVGLPGEQEDLVLQEPALHGRLPLGGERCAGGAGLATRHGSRARQRRRAACLDAKSGADEKRTGGIPSGVSPPTVRSAAEDWHARQVKFTVRGIPPTNQR